jgi:mono/diheme cytochrome c family protein
MRLAFMVGLAVLTAVSTPEMEEPHAMPADPIGSPPATQVEEGKLLYGIYCVNCHGDHGRGNGPSAKSLNPPPPDLTRLSRDNEGKFPSARVILAIDGRSRVPGHLNGQMPIWGLSLQEPGRDANQEAEIREKIERLVRFLESIQTR